MGLNYIGYSWQDLPLRTLNHGAAATRRTQLLMQRTHKVGFDELSMFTMSINIRIVLYGFTQLLGVGYRLLISAVVTEGCALECL